MISSTECSLSIGRESAKKAMKQEELESKKEELLNCYHFYKIKKPEIISGFYSDYKDLQKQVYLQSECLKQLRYTRSLLIRP